MLNKKQIERLESLLKSVPVSISRDFDQEDFDKELREELLRMKQIAIAIEDIDDRIKKLKTEKTRLEREIS